MQKGSDAWISLTDAYLGLLKEPIKNGMTIGIENLHMAPKMTPDDSRGFGYLPFECIDWVENLKESSGYKEFGIHLDIGHAFNNLPFSRQCNIGQWYTLIGGHTVGYHLHQVNMIDGLMKNHFPIKDVYGPMISLSSFFLAWNSGMLNHAPMFLEIRDDNFQEAIDSLECVRSYIQV